MSAARRTEARARPAARAKAGKSAARAKTAASPRFWLVKTDASSYSIADLERDGVSPWTGVRNYQARNTLRDDMKPGDRVLVYHSRSDPLLVAGVAEVASLPRPDETAFKKNDDHYDPDSDPSDPTWWLVDLRHVETFKSPVTRERLAAEPRLRRMVLLQRGSRLSVQPVTAEEFSTVLALAHGAGGRKKKP
ncbi:MAG TPA: EVE domain-containing protein [Planctomycetota bacterium]|nr:EVE domain-containing protein [Planctomycetota bacterium]